MKKKLANIISQSLFTTLSLMIDAQMYHTKQIASVLMVLADKKKLPPRMMDHEDKFLSVLKRFGFTNRDTSKLPYPVIAVMPPDINLWKEFVDDVADDLNSDTYALVSEARGTRREVWEDCNRKFESIHPDNLQDYVLMHLSSNGKSRSFAAPIRYNIVDREENTQRRIGDWKEYSKYTESENQTTILWHKPKGDNDARTT